MVIGKIRPMATIVAQFAAGVEIEAIQHEGKMFLPAMNLGDFSMQEKPSTMESPSKGTPKAESVKEGGDEKTPYSKDELMSMETKQLYKICKDEFGINPDDYDGKNTNRKLRDLILEAQENDGAEEETEESEDTSTSKKPASKKTKPVEETEEEANEDEDDLVDKVADLLEDFDAGKKNKKKTLSAIIALSENADEDAVTELIEHFEEDADADLDETAEKIAAALKGKVEKKPAKRGKKEKENLVSPDDLEVGDKVSVWWDDDNQTWFDGEVKSIKKGKILIAYEDDTEEYLDEEIHTKIKRLAE